MTRRLVRGLFELDDLGPQHLKGFSEPLAVWRVMCETVAEGRFEAQRAKGLTPFIGREEELALLLRRWKQARDGEGQVVLLSGEPGIGKSRLVRELRARLEGEPHLRLSYQCSPYHQTSPLHPVIEQLQRAAGFERDEPAGQKLDKLERMLALGTRNLGEAVSLIAALLGLPSDNRCALPELTPQRQKQRTLEVLLAQLDGLSAGQPVLVVYEDVHWIDPTAEELLGLSIERAQGLPVLFVLTFRPEFKPPWTGQPHLSTLALTRLARRDGAAIVDRVVGAKALPAEISEQIVAKTDGVPLFVEELTKTVLESGLLTAAGDRYEVSGPLPPLAIPATLHDSLMARLDRLAPVKEVAQIGATIGRDFSHTLLAAVADRPQAELQSALDQLVASELLFRRGIPPDATYSFKHALVQDAAYGTLLRSRRQQLHGRIAAVLEEQFPATVKTQPELLARHCMSAGLVERAIDYWHNAGRQAMARCAAKESIAHLTIALEQLAGLPNEAGQRLKELELQLTLGEALTMAKGWASPEMGRAHARARDLCRELTDAPRVLPALFGMWMFHQNRAEFDAAFEIAEELLRVAEAQDDIANRFLGHRSLAGTLMFQASFGAALRHFQEAVAIYGSRPLKLPIFGTADPRVACSRFTSWIRLFQGHLDRAAAQSQEALVWARDTRHAYTSGFALHVDCLFHQIRRDRAGVEERATALIELATAQDFPHLLGTATFFHGWALMRGGAIEAGIDEMRRGLAAKRATGAEIKVPYYLALLASTYASAGEHAKASALLDDALARVDETGERWFEAELHRHRGEVWLLLPTADPTAAEACFRKAIAVAQQQEAKLWELRAATSLGRLWRDQGRRSEARELLAPVYGWFTEGFDTADLKDAKALLDQL